MRVIARAALIAAALASTPAPAAIVSYAFTAGGPGKGLQFSYEQICNPAGCSYTYYHQSFGHEMAGVFSLDTAKLTHDRLPLSDRGASYEADTSGLAPSFGARSDVSLAGGIAPVPTPATRGGLREHLFAYENGAPSPGSPGQFVFLDYAVFNQPPPERDANGVVRRRSYEYALNILETYDVPDVALVDGFDLPVALGVGSFDGWFARIESTTLWYEAVFDAAGQLTASTFRVDTALAELTSIKVSISEVPEPAGSGLLGLGLIGFACLRRREQIGRDERQG